MTVSSTLNKISYEGDGSNTTFNIPFYVLSENDLAFTIVNETTLEETSITDNFTLTAINDTWPSVTSELLYPVVGDPITEGYKLVITRNVALKQETSFGQNAAIQPKVVEQAFDKNTMMIQQLEEELTRCIKASATSGVDPEALITQILAAVTSCLQSATNANESATSASNSATSAANSATEAETAANTLTYATQEEAEAGTADNRISSPLRVFQAILAKIASTAEAQTGTDDTKIMTPAKVSALISYILATQAEAEAGTDNTKLMTPLRVSEAISSISSSGQQVFTASGTFTVPTGVTTVYVDGAGGGGGGANCSSMHGSGGGGGGAAVANEEISVTSGEEITVTIGAGGANGNVASSGGTTSFGSYLSLAGGGGASGYTGGSSGGDGGAAGQASLDYATTLYHAGSGGGTIWGPTTLFPYATNHSGVDGTGYGTGGSGASANTSNNGGSGAQGFIRIRW